MPQTPVHGRPPLPVPLASWAVRDAWRVTLEHLAFHREVWPGAVEVEARKLPRSSALKSALERLRTGPLTVTLVDLHGMRAKGARTLLAKHHDAACLVVYFGKSGGVMYDVLHAFLAADPDAWTAVGAGGSTDERPKDAMAVLLRRDVAEAFAHAVQVNEAPSPRRRAPARARPARPRPRPRSRARSEAPRLTEQDWGCLGCVLPVLVGSAVVAFASWRTLLAAIYLLEFGEGTSEAIEAQIHTYDWLGLGDPSNVLAAIALSTGLCFACLGILGELFGEGNRSS